MLFQSMFVVQDYLITYHCDRKNTKRFRKIGKKIFDFIEYEGVLAFFHVFVR